MNPYGRRLIRTSALTLKALYDEARADLAQLSFEYQCRMADLDRALAATRRELDELRAAVLARQHAEAELAELRRLQAIGRARAQERDPALPLQ